MLRCDLSKKQSVHERSDARSDNEEFTDPQKGRRQGQGESPHVWFFIVMLRDLEKNGAVDTGHDECGGQGKGSRGDNPSADCQTTNGEGDAYLCPGVQASPSVRWAWERTSVAVSVSRRKDKIAYKLKKAQNGEPYLRLPCGVNSDGHAALARNAQTEVNQACPPRLR